MTRETTLTFELPEGEHDLTKLSNAVYAAGFEEALPTCFRLIESRESSACQAVISAA